MTDLRGAFIFGANGAAPHALPQMAAGGDDLGSHALLWLWHPGRARSATRCRKWQQGENND